MFRPPVTSGQMVAELDPIADLIDPGTIYVQASIPLDELHLVSAGMPATVTSDPRVLASYLAASEGVVARSGRMAEIADAVTTTAPDDTDPTTTVRNP